MSWQQIGALEGGTVGGLVLVREQTQDGERSVLLAVTPAGSFRSEDARSWQPLSPEPGPALADAIAASPAFERDRSLFVAGRTGLFCSTDGGRSWRHAIDGEVLTVAVSPAFADDPLLFAGTAQDGALRSVDGGLSWGGANSGLLDLTVLSVALSPRFSEDRTAFVGTASGLYRSRNGGRSWREVMLGTDPLAVQVLAVSPKFGQDKLVLAGTEANGLLRSDDGGARFSEVPELAGHGISAVLISQDGRTVVVAAGSDLWRSDDGGRSWTPLPEAPGLVLALAHLPESNQASREPVLVAGLHRLGIARLDAEGRWQPGNGGLQASLLTWLAPSPGFAQDRTLYGLSLDEGLLISRDGGQSWARSWPDEADPSIATLAIAAETSNASGGRAILASTVEQAYRSGDGGDSWEAQDHTTAPPLRTVIPLPPGGKGTGFIGVGRAVVDGRETAGIVLSEDGGRSWRPIGQISAAEPGWSLDVGALAASPAYWQDRTLVARGVETRADGQATTRLWRSTDGGRTWAVWLEAAGVGGSILPSTLLLPPSFPSGSAIVVAIGAQVLTPVPGSWERRGGQRRPVWQAASFGPEVASVTALAVPPSDATGAAAGRTIYAGTNAGPYVSRDGGKSFQPWSDGYEGGGIVALAVSPAFATDRLVLAVGVGGTIWQIQDA
jgi:photosystem II stability/assembly factor-like uncharacterized protein